MKRKKSGKRHPLLLYRRFMDRLWGAALPFTMVLLAVWLVTYFFEIDLWGLNSDLWLLVGILVSALLALVAYFAGKLAYVQARQDYLLVATAFFRLKISYRRVLSVRASAFHQVFPPNKLGWAEKNFLEPFWADTVLVMELKNYPLAEWILRLNFPRFMFNPSATGLILQVEDWMALSAEIDTYQGLWRQEQARRKRRKDESTFRLR